MLLPAKKLRHSATRGRAIKMTDLIDRIREIIERHRDFTAARGYPCQCTPEELSDHSRHVAREIVARLGLRPERAVKVKDEIRYLSAWFDDELTKLEGSRLFSVNGNGVRAGIDGQVRAIASALVSRVDELAQSVASAVRAEVEFYKRTGLVTSDELLASCTDNIQFALKCLESAADFDTSPAVRDGFQTRRRGRSAASGDGCLPHCLTSPLGCRGANRHDTARFHPRRADLGDHTDLAHNRTPTPTR